jgi:hypothetical protein
MSVGSDLLFLLLNLENLNVMTSITEQQKIKADHLFKILQGHFKQHLIHCIKDKYRCTHWSMHFAHSNLAVIAACMVLSNHAANKLWCLQDSDSLLSSTPYNYYQCAWFPNCKGAYLYYMMVTKEYLFAVVR